MACVKFFLDNSHLVVVFHVHKEMYEWNPALRAKERNRGDSDRLLEVCLVPVFFANPIELVTRPALNQNAPALACRTSVCPSKLVVHEHTQRPQSWRIHQSSCVQSLVLNMGLKS